MLPVVIPLAAQALNAVAPKLREAAEKFEAQAMGQLLGPAYTTAGVAKPPFGGGTAEAQWRPMLVDAMAQQAVRGGKGSGLAPAVMSEMIRQQGGGA